MSSGIEAARPLNGIKSTPGDLRKEEMKEFFFDGLSLGDGKRSGPSPGVGHKLLSLEILGERKDSGPSQGSGH
ncbi:hypothetical protein RJ641_011395 [Dillenia turbinata]|uniref:Uncharacterized protein n=1 Tax=Dillenia turbinata TaxID=194707 RepID=A0AAN8V3R7_9MAGN